jgi:hypothetical protein
MEQKVACRRVVLTVCYTKDDFATDASAESQYSTAWKHRGGRHTNCRRIPRDWYVQVQSSPKILLQRRAPPAPSSPNTEPLQHRAPPAPSSFDAEPIFRSLKAQVRPPHECVDVLQEIGMYKCNQLEATGPVLVLGTRRDETRSEYGPGRLVSSRQNVRLARR